MFSSPVVVNGTIYIGSDDGYLYAINAEGTASSKDSRVLLGTLNHHDNRLHTDKERIADRNSADSSEINEIGDTNSGTEVYSQHDRSTNDFETKVYSSNNESTNFCSHCGEDLRQRQIDTFCPVCGSKLV